MASRSALALAIVFWLAAGSLLEQSLRGTPCEPSANELEDIGCLLGELYPVRAGYGRGQESSTTPATIEDEVADLASSAAWQRMRARARRSPEEEASEALVDTAGVYGELSVAGAAQLRDALLNLRPEAEALEEVFFDVGSGVGKVVAQLFLTAPLLRTVGVELDEARHEVARLVGGALARALSMSNSSGSSWSLDGRQLEFLQGDMLAVDYGDATALFVCSLAFPAGLTMALAERIAATAQPGTLVFVGARLPGCHRGLLQLHSFEASASWTVLLPIFVYVVTPASSDAQLGSLRRHRLALAGAEPLRAHRERGELPSLAACVLADLEALGEAASSEDDWAAVASRARSLGPAERSAVLGLAVAKRLRTLAWLRCQERPSAHRRRELQRQLQLLGTLLRAGARPSARDLESAAAAADEELVALLGASASAGAEL